MSDRVYGLLLLGTIVAGLLLTGWLFHGTDLIAARQGDARLVGGLQAEVRSLMAQNAALRGQLRDMHTLNAVQAASLRETPRCR